MKPKQLVRLALLILAVLAVSALVWMQSVTAQQGGDGGYGGAGGAGTSGFGATGTEAYDGTGGIGGAGGAGGGGGYGGAGGAGGGGGGGGMFLPSTESRLAAFGEYVYVLRLGRLYQYAAYDLTLVKKINVSDAAANKRTDRRRESAGGRGADGGAGGDGADGANGGQGGAGGFGGGFAFMQAASSEDVAAAGDFVYVLQGDKLHKLAADGLTSIKTKTLKFDQ